MTGHRFAAAGALALAVVIGIALAGPAAAQTPRIQGQGTAASGMGNAFTAQADDPSAIHYNPAGMTQLHGVQNMFGALFIGGTTNFTSATTGQNTTGDRGGSVAWPPPGHVYVTANLKDLGFKALGDLSAGIGLTSPFGSLIRYPDNGPLRTAVTFTTLPLLDIKPTLAYKISDKLSVGLGADIYTFSGLFGEGHIEQQSISPIGGSKLELNGSDTAGGFNVSMLYAPFLNQDGKPLATIGFVYRSQATLHFTGEFRSNGALLSDARATLVLPPVYSLGLALWPVRDAAREWKLEVDVDYIQWHVNRNLDVHLSNAGTPFGSTIRQPQNWQNAVTVMAGTEYRWLQLERLPHWDAAVRAGYMHQQAQVPDFTFNPGTPAADTHIPSVGFGLTCHKDGMLFGHRCGDLGWPKFTSIGMDVSYQAVIYESRAVSGNRNPTVNGRYDTLSHVGGMSVRLTF
jgi:long-chain fatty acid transport protein